MHRTICCEEEPMHGPYRAFLCMVWALLCAGLPSVAFGGTTGVISGRVIDASTRSGIADVLVTASSPSQVERTTTTADGSFTFAALAPDTYAVSTHKAGYADESFAGITVFADNVVSLNITTQEALKTIARVHTRPASDLVKPGTVSDVYSVNASSLQTERNIGGAGDLNQAYAALSAEPGVETGGGQGWLQGVYIRGSSFEQTGFEYDGVPINRYTENYQAGTESTLGTQELQVYTGGGPAGSAATGLGGFVNQVIKTGTYPGYADAEFGLGGPAFYHEASLEVGGSNPDRTFSYYAGFLGTNQDFRYINQYGGPGEPNADLLLRYPIFGVTTVPLVAPQCEFGVNPYAVGLAPPPEPSYSEGTSDCLSTVSSAAQFYSTITDREVVANFHFAIPHRDGDGRDDVQLLFSNSAMNQYAPDSVDDLGASTFVNAYGAVPTWPDYPSYPSSVTFGEPAAGLTPVTYLYPNSPTDRAAYSSIPDDQQDVVSNDDTILKLQYQRNFSSTAYLRAFAYTFYSDWLGFAPVEDSELFNAVMPVDATPFDERSHTAGAELQFADQIDSHNFIQLTVNESVDRSESYENIENTSNVNELLGGGYGLSSQTTNLVANGTCYSDFGTPAPCIPASAYVVTLGGFPVTGCVTGIAAACGTFQNPTPYPAVGAALAAGAQWLVTNPLANINPISTTPVYSSYSFSDEWRPSDAVDVDAGVRLDRFQYELPGDQNTASNFWTQQIRQDMCYDPATLSPYLTPTLTCPAGYVHPNGVSGAAYFTDVYPSSIASNVWEPRVGFTWTLGPNTVIRAKYGKYAEPPQSNVVVEPIADSSSGASQSFFDLLALGRFTPLTGIAPTVATNYDVSLEHRIDGTNVTFKLTPFYKEVENDLQFLLISRSPELDEVVNDGNERMSGVEFQLADGDFSRNGWSAIFSYTYTYARLQYTNLGSTGVNVIDQINGEISTYNLYTKADGGSPCYTAGGVGTACSTPGSWVNPYYASAPQPLLDRNGWYEPLTASPGVPAYGFESYQPPSVATLVLNYKHDRFSVTPSLVYDGGIPYGAPLTSLGIDPKSCAANQEDIPSAVAAGRGQYPDVTTCSNAIEIPDYETGTFDGQGEFSEPDAVTLNANLSYQVTPRISLTLFVNNLYSACFAGSREPWNDGGSHVCTYGIDSYFSGMTGVSNFYNGSSPNDKAANGALSTYFSANPYYPLYFTNPVQLYVTLNYHL